MSHRASIITRSRLLSVMDHLSIVLNDNASDARTRDETFGILRTKVTGDDYGPLGMCSVIDDRLQQVIQNTATLSHPVKDDVPSRYLLIAGVGRDEVRHIILSDNINETLEIDLEQRHPHDHARRFEWIRICDLDAGTYSYARMGWIAPTPMLRCQTDL
jgi:hypothetical protein